MQLMPANQSDFSIQHAMDALQQRNADLSIQLAQIKLEQIKWSKRESALLELLNVYRTQSKQFQLLLNQRNNTATPKIVLAKGTSSSGESSDENSPSPTPEPSTTPPFPRETFFEIALLESQIQSFAAQLQSVTEKSRRSIKELLEDESMGPVLRRRHLLSQTAALAQVESLPSRIDVFISEVSKLRKLYTSSQDFLARSQYTQFEAHATSYFSRLLALPPSQLPHPLELTFRFHNLPSTLKLLCEQSGCSGGSSCVHKVNPELNALMAVTVVHPGSSYRTFGKYLFGALKGATQLRGELFILIRRTEVRLRGEVLDDETWRRKFDMTKVVDVGWVGISAPQGKLEGDVPLPLGGLKKRRSMIPVPVARDTEQKKWRERFSV
ncbi:hypothetical protein RUND412_002613 [Rhizina undulata]